MTHPNGTITANFKQAIKGDINIDVIAYFDGGGSGSSLDIEYKVSPGVHIIATYWCVSYLSRDNGYSEEDAWAFDVFENERINLDQRYDDGYGNVEDRTSTLIGFKVEVDGRVIYENNSNFPTEAHYPNDGDIHNGYRFHINFM